MGVISNTFVQGRVGLKIGNTNKDNMRLWMGRRYRESIKLPFYRSKVFFQRCSVVRTSHRNYCYTASNLRSIHCKAFVSGDKHDCVSIWPVGQKEMEEKLSMFDERTRTFAEHSGFAGEEGQVLPIPSFGKSNDTEIMGWLFGTGEGNNPFVFGMLPNKLPPATYIIESSHISQEEYLGWGLGTYQFDKYKGQSKEKKAPQLYISDETTKEKLDIIASGIFLGRDLINTPCCDLGPSDLASSAREIAKKCGATIKVIEDKPLRRDFPLVHAVGRAAASGREPLVIDLHWGDKKHPKVTLVGKGVCFDTGGLDIKPASNMVTMKKDMGGAASILALAFMIMSSNLNVNLRVLIPAVENSISGNAFRPSDVITSRSGLTVEIGNTDAEGRLILADCLTVACEDNPDLLIDMATLTGAHRVALGWDLPGIFTDSDEMAADLYEYGLKHEDPVWRLPLWKPYAKFLDSKIADMNNIGSVPWGGAITAALFLQKFVCVPNWIHIDFNGWTRDKAGFPEGGEPQAVRAIFELLQEKYK